MANIFWRPSGSDSAYGQDATLDDMERYDELMVEFVEAAGHSIDVGSRTDSDQDEQSCDDEDVDLNELFHAAWEYACYHIDDESA